MTALPLADPEIAAAEFKAHLDAYWIARKLEERGWSWTKLDPLHVIVVVPAFDGEVEADYRIRLGAEYYDLYPPTVLFVDPSGARARAGTPWWPKIDPPPWFQLHDEYGFPGGITGQLACFSMTAEYYITDHGPTDDQRWRKGDHTVAATLSRLGELLSPPNYKGFDGDRAS